jgi:CubicO group peptidase (beta-lactamase class C family)
MPFRIRPSLVALTLPTLLLAACGRGSPPEPPLPPEALKAVVQDPGTNREKLARAVDALFSTDGIGETRAVLVLHNGRVAAERYGDGYGPDTKFLGWSMSKTVTGVLTGMLVAEGRLRLDDAAPVPPWQRAGDPRGEITLRQLLQMRSGLRHHEKAEPVYTSSEVRMLVLDGRDDMAAWAEAQPLEHEPGRTFEYSTATPMILTDIAARVLAPNASPEQRRAAVDEFLHTRLAGPLKMPSLTAEYDRAGTMLGGSMVWATARDWGRFGEFLRHKGSAGGVQVVPRGWIEFMMKPSPRAPDFGAMLWLNRPSGTKDRELLFPDKGPRSLVAAIGHLGQYVLVAPDQHLTVVRLGKTDQDDRPELVRTLAGVIDAYRK